MIDILLLLLSSSLCLSANGFAEAGLIKNATVQPYGHIVTITPDLADIIEYSYNFVKGHCGKALTEINACSRYNGFSANSLTLINAFNNIIQIIDNNRQNLPKDRNWDAIKDTLKLQIDELTKKNKTLTTNDCICNNCKSIARKKGKPRKINF